MAEDIVEPQSQQPATTTVDPEVAKLMDISLNGFQKPQAQPSQEGVANTPPASADTPPVSTTQPPVFSFDTLKEKFGYQSPDDAFKEIEELRTLKANPPQAGQPQIKFENEQSEKLFNAIQKGERKTVYNILAQQERLEELTTKEVSKETAADLIKFGMQLKYKDLSPQEIEYKFNKDFGLPKEPVQGDAEDEEEFKARKEEWSGKVYDIEMNRMIEAKLLKPELESAKQKLVLPQADSDVDEGYAQYQKILSERPKLTEDAVNEYKTFNADFFETKMPFNDEANKVAFEFQFEPDDESFKQTLETVSDMDKFWKLFQGQDGKPDRKKFFKAFITDSILTRRFPKL
jgi:hypothetical protein